LALHQAQETGLGIVYLPQRPIPFGVVYPVERLAWFTGTVTQAVAGSATVLADRDDLGSHDLVDDALHEVLHLAVYLVGAHEPTNVPMPHQSSTHSGMTMSRPMTTPLMA
jgi:hypothetical protein